MPLQDLTPELRLRPAAWNAAWAGSSCWRRCCCSLVLAITSYKTAEERGTTKIKAPFFIYVESGSGLNLGDKVKLMGFEVGRITQIKPMPPTWGQSTTNNVYVKFEIVDQENFNYIWTQGSHVELKGAWPDKRGLNLTKGTTGYAVYSTQPLRDDLTVSEAEALPNLDKWRLGQESNT